MNTILYAVVPLAICIFNLLLIIAVLREQARSVRINNAYHTAYRRLREWSLHYVMNSKSSKEIEMIQQLLNKDHALIIEAHKKLPLFKRNTSI